MKSALWQKLSGFRLSTLVKACLRLVKRLIKLLEIPAPEAPQWIHRIGIMERDIMLPIKAAAIAMIYYFYFTRWILVAHNELDVEVEAVEFFFWVYIGINIIVAALLIRMHHLPLALMQWVVFVIILVDGIFLSALTLVTLGYRSFLYWLFLALIVRSAVSIPRATSQILLNLTIIICYVLAGVIDISVAKHLEEQARALAIMRGTVYRTTGVSRHLPRSERLVAETPTPTNRAVAHPLASPTATDTYLPSDWDAPPKLSLTASGEADSPAEPLIVRLVLLLLMTVCSYGVQVLLERQRQVAEEAREFALREGQLHAAGRLAAEFAHKIKNPLSIINNAAYSLQRGFKNHNSDAAEQLQIIKEEVERSDRIITQIMGYAQLSEGRVERLNVLEELDRAINQVLPPAAKYDIQVHRDFDSEFPPLLMLRRHLSDTFVNLLQNAREALDGKGGNIFITAHCRRDFSIEVSIRDDGPGIANDKKQQIFEAYYTTKEKGTGIGLATVKHNVELYGGAVHLDSELGKGARFTLVFPPKSVIKLENNA
jgi:signal transduction histidine kinase